MTARPGRRVERRAQARAGLDRRDEIRLIGEHGREPQFAEQRVAQSRSDGRTAGGFQPLADQIDGHRGRPALRDELTGRGQEARTIELRSPIFLDYCV